MRSKLDDPRIRAKFLKAYAKTGRIAHAAQAIGMSPAAAASHRYRRPEFRAACDAVLAGAVPAPGARPAAFTPARRDAFLTALAEAGSIEAAALRAGVSSGTAYDVRRRDARFAADWADARDRSLDRIEDRLFEAALGGFEQTVTGKDGAVVTRRTQQAGPMFKLLESRRRPGRSNRMLEVTPARLAEARARFEAALRRAAETGELPPPALATLPPPTVTAR